MLEEERAYQVDDGFSMPDLAGCAPPGGRVLPRAPMTLLATYYDTDDYRFARAGVRLRYRRGEFGARPWTARLPCHLPGNHREIGRLGPAGEVPHDLVGLLTAYHRGARPRPAAVLRTVRLVSEVRDADERPLVRIAEDTISVLDGRHVTMTFREIGVTRQVSDGNGNGPDDGARSLDRIRAVLLAAGATSDGSPPRHVRAMGEAAMAPPDPYPPDPYPPVRPPGRPTVADVIAAALRRDVARIIRCDPFVRLREPLPAGDTPVRQMRIGCHRLRSDLRTLRPLLHPAWADALRAELGWLADALGATTDAEVLRARLHRTAEADPLAPPDRAAIARLDADLAARHEESLLALDAALASPRYVALLDRLVDAARDPMVSDEPEVSTPVARSLRRLVEAGIDRLGPDVLDGDWHELRDLGTRARRATARAATVLGDAVGEFATALAAIPGRGDERQEAALAGETWLAIAASDPDDHALAVTAGRLYERERAALWRTTRGGVMGWLRRR